MIDDVDDSLTHPGIRVVGWPVNNVTRRRVTPYTCRRDKQTYYTIIQYTVRKTEKGSAQKEQFLRSKL